MRSAPAVSSIAAREEREPRSGWRRCGSGGVAAQGDVDAASRIRSAYSSPSSRSGSKPAVAT